MKSNSICKYNIYQNTGGNNCIISLVLVKYELDALLDFMQIIHKILIQDNVNDFEIIEEFNIIENDQTYNLHEYIDIKLNEFYDCTNLDEIKENDRILTLKSLFVISFIYDIRVKVFILGDHDLLENVCSKIPRNININYFINQCNQIINSFKNNQISFKEIGHYTKNEWINIGLYVIENK